ncbi:MAG: DNA polymerase Y family protein [Candidatus Rokubacteria bacterium]|nr:DNA polymerase Y family protein [Candidatus Rokubacteria bacterium]
MSRFACVWVDWFTAAAAERCEPALRDEALAIVAPGPSIKRVIDANAAARAAGVRPGMTETEARAGCPALVSRPWAAAHVASARHALLEAALGVSPRVEDAGAGIVHVDAAGLTRLHGDAAAVGRRLLRQAERVGFAARVALAESRTVARLVAASASGPLTVVPAGNEERALAAVPLAALGLDAHLAPALAQWGVRTLGELAALPRAGVAMRLGPAGLDAHDRALGRDREPFRAWTPPPFWEEAQGLEWEVDSLGALALVLERVLERLCARLTAAHLAADALDVRLELASGGHHERTVTLAVPMGEAKPMLALLALELERHPPGAAVTRVTVSARPVQARAGQGGLWQPPAPALRDLGAVLVRLAELVGPDNVGSPALLDSHRPDAYALLAFAPPHEPDALSDRRDAVGPVTGSAPRPASSPPRLDESEHRLVLRRVRPARRVAVETDGERPARVEGWRVVACAGPWRASGEWWDAEAWARDEWDAALADGVLCRLAHDRLTGAWHLDGVYD